MRYPSDQILSQWIADMQSGERLSAEVYTALLGELSAEQQLYVRQCACETAVRQFGKGIYVRGLMEISSYCRNNCYYCGIRRSNPVAERYRLSHEEVMECCRRGAKMGFNTFVLQGGEDALQDDAWIENVVRAIRKEFPDKAVTLSVGERTAEAYARFKAAGADRYLLRHETRNAEHYRHLHPSDMSQSNRLQCLDTLKALGYQTGAGLMVGSPGQTVGHLAEDLFYLDELQPEMIGVGPFIATPHTPFARERNGSVEQTLLLVALLRLRFPRVLLPSTTALATLDPEGQIKAVLSGANVLMPNLTPPVVREKYAIYSNKANARNETAEAVKTLEQQLNKIGYHIDWSRGDYPYNLTKEEKHV